MTDSETQLKYPNNISAICAEYVSHETRFLQDTLDQLKSIRSALLEHNSERLEQATDAAFGEPQQIRFDRMQQARQEIRKRVSEQCGIPHEAVVLAEIVRLAESESTDSARVLCERVQELSKSIDTYNRRNAILAGQLSSITTRVIETLVGTTNASYASTGQILTEQKSFLFEREV